MPLVVARPRQGVDCLTGKERRSDVLAGAIEGGKWDSMRQKREADGLSRTYVVRVLTCSGMGWSMTEEGWTCCKLAVASVTGAFWKVVVISKDAELTRSSGLWTDAGRKIASQYLLILVAAVSTCGVQIRLRICVL